MIDRQAAGREGGDALAFQPVVLFRDVVKRFESRERRVTAIAGLSAEVKPGCITGLVGPDGAGKTTLMRLMAGLLRPNSGIIRVLGLDSQRDSAAVQAAVGYMPQRFGLYEDLSVLENLSLYADLQGVTGAERQARFARLLDFTALEPFQKRLAGRLSGGMKQKLGLACVLIRQPRLLLLDEPSVGVDPVSRRELWKIVEALVAEGVSVLWSTAYLDEAERCAEVLLLREGELLHQGPPGPVSEGLKGRVFSFPGGGADKRAFIPKLKARPFVLDALIKGSDIHFLLAKRPDDEELRELIAVIGAAARGLKPVRPTFEDAFIAILAARQAAPAEALRAAEAEPEAAPPMPVPAPAPAPMPLETKSGQPVIEVRRLVRAFGAFRAVDGIDFDVARGEIFGLLGPNGAGKSTTFKMLCGLLPPTGGKALVLGIDLGRASAAARGRIGYMAQKFSLYETMSVRQNMRFFASAYGLGGRKRERRIARTLAELGMTDLAEARSADLPLGFKQRLSLACAIMHDPGILFLDEPTSGVDPLVRREFWGRINAMAAAGVTVMVTTHFLEEAEYCDRIGIVYRGKLIALGAPEALKAEHRTPARPAPTLEESFIDLIETYDAAAGPTGASA